MSKYKVYSCSFDLTDENYPRVEMKGDNVLEGNPFVATEILDTETNSLLENCHNEFDIEDQYESFWNRLNGDTELKKPYQTTNSNEKVKVIRVVKLD
jgi:hypothetical protein